MNTTDKMSELKNEIGKLENEMYALEDEIFELEEKPDAKYERYNELVNEVLEEERKQMKKWGDR